MNVAMSLRLPVAASPANFHRPSTSLLPVQNSIPVHAATSAASSHQQQPRSLAVCASPTALEAPLSASPSASDAEHSSVSPAAASQSRLLFLAGAFMMPHPDKVAKGGEDGFFIADHQRALGVADGVGSWAEANIDAGLYARQLMGFAKSASELDKPSESTSDVAAQLSAQTIFQAAYDQVDALGSCTSCILVLNGSTLHVSNLGDSGFMVMRDGRVVTRSKQQQHGFNFPFQVGCKGSQSDAPSAAQQYKVKLAAGDVVVVATDGVWDNCFDHEIFDVVKYCRSTGLGANKAAHVLAHYARLRASDNKSPSPFTYSAHNAGYQMMGGKLDDITVVFAYVEEAVAACT